jgi:2-dehydropantoate 2-reductase
VKALRILVVGAGATGGYFGGRLALAGRDVTFLVRPARAEALERDGLRIVSPHGNATLQPSVVRAGDIASTYDVILLAVKGFGLEAALDDFAPAVGDATAILPVQNGMRHMDVLRERFGAARVLGGVSRIMSTLDDDGRVVQLTDIDEIVYGEYPAGTSARIDALDRTMRGAGFTARASTDIARDMWEKWVMLASLGGITCLMRGTIGDVEAVSGGGAFALAFLAECAEVARAAGFPMTRAYVDRVGPILTERGSGMTSSMYRDLASGRSVEADEILGDLLVRARAERVPTPLLAAAYANLSIYSRRARLHERGST